MQHFSQADELRVPVLRTHIEISTEHDATSAVMFLAPESSPSDIFEMDGPAFFPVEVDGKVRLYARSSVVSLVVDVGHSAAEALLVLGVAYERRGVAVHLRDGKVVTGSLMSLHGRQRTLDLMNEPAKSLALRTDGKVHHIAKAFVERIEEV